MRNSRDLPFIPTEYGTDSLRPMIWNYRGDGMMRFLNRYVCLSVMSVMGLGLLGQESNAAGPAVAQQSIAQIQSQLTQASIGWRHWRRCCGYGGWGYGGWGYGGWGGGYRGWGYGGYGGWGGYGGYGGYYGGYGYPYYGGYTGYSYVRPVIYSYPAYSYYTPRYYSSYSYASPYCCSNSTYTPTVYGVSSYSYSPTPASYTSTAPSYSVPTVYGGSTNVISSPTPISTPSVVYPASNSYQAPAPYPGPPVDIPQPSTYRAPIATTPVLTVQNGYSAYPAAPSVISSPSYSPNYAYTGVSATAYNPPSYGYYQLPDPYSRPATVSTLSRLSAGIVW